MFGAYKAKHSSYHWKRLTVSIIKLFDAPNDAKLFTMPDDSQGVSLRIVSSAIFCWTILEHCSLTGEVTATKMAQWRCLSGSAFWIYELHSMKIHWRPCSSQKSAARMNAESAQVRSILPFEISKASDSKVSDSKVPEIVSFSVESGCGT